MSDEPQALEPIEVKAVDFYGDAIAGALVLVEGERRIYVPVRPICEYLGLTWPSQTLRLRRDPILAAEVKGVFIMKTPQEGGPQEMLCLPLDLLPGWLFGITSSKVKEEHREKITRYRRECFRVLWEAFRPEIEPATDLASPSGRSGAELAYEIATAVQHLARQQMELERRVDQAGLWARQITGTVKSHDTRISALELTVGPRSPIDDEQAAALAAAVRAVGHALETRGVGDYRGVYGQLYARFGITSYKNLPRERYEKALAWLHAWYAEVTGAGRTDG
jgi:hypothetical protein